jgi:hypothetical protein
MPPYENNFKLSSEDKDSNIHAVFHKRTMLNGDSQFDEIYWTEKKVK